MKPILSASFELPSDGFHHAMALGEFPNSLLEPDPAKPGSIRRRRVVQICDRAACDAIVAAFNRAAAVQDFPGLLVDRDHESDDPDKTTDAWGWVTEMQNRDDGLYVRIRWTDLGEPAVRGGRFRFLSPVFDPDACEDLGNNRLRPSRLEKLGLTNDPNIKALRPISNRSQEPAPADSGTKNAGDPGRKESTMDFKAKLLALLGLAADATDEQIDQAIAAKTSELENASAEKAKGAELKNRAEAAEAKVVSFERAALEAQVEKDLETHKDVIENRDEVKVQLLANREGTLKLLCSLRKPAAAESAAAALRNRDTKAPGDKTLANRAQEQSALVNSIRDRARQAGRPVPFERAWELARSEKPELFREESK